MCDRLTCSESYGYEIVEGGVVVWCYGVGTDPSLTKFAQYEMTRAERTASARV